MSAPRPHRPCVECGEPTDIYSRQTLHELRGWEKARHGGGLNHVLFKESTGRVMCERCARTRQLTGSAGQGALL